MRDTGFRLRVIWMMAVFVVIICLSLLLAKYNNLFEYGISNDNLGRLGPIANDALEIIPNYDMEEILQYSNGTIFINPSRLDLINISPKRIFMFNVSKHKIVYGFNASRDTIVLIGDSYTQGSGVGENETFGYILSENSEYNFVNLACGGYNTRLEVESLEREGVKYDPKIVVIQYAFNDYEDTFVLYSLMDSVKSTLIKNGVPFNNSYVDFLVYDFYNTQIYQKNVDHLLNLNVIEPLEKLYTLSKKYGFKVILLKIPVPNNQDKIVENAAKKYKWILVDLNKKIGFHYEVPFILGGNDEHFSRETHKKVAELLDKEIDRIIGKNAI